MQNHVQYYGLLKLKHEFCDHIAQVVSLTRRRRHSFSAASTDHLQHLPTLTDNVLYDMDSTTDPSSSDSDSIPRNRVQAPLISIQKGSKGEGAKRSPLVQQNLKENRFNPQSTSGGGENRSRRRPPPIKSKEVAAAAPQKRWM